MKKSMDIAREHLRRMNPSNWNGKGDQPEDFNPKIATYDIDKYLILDISFEFEDGEWTHYCELRNRESENLLNALHGYGVDSPQNLADTIADVSTWIR